MTTPKKTTKPKTITPAQIATIEQAQAAGKTRQEAATAAGVSVTTVALHWKPTGSGKRTGPTRAKVVARLKAGESNEAIAEALKVSVPTVRRYRREIEGARAYHRRDDF